MGSLGDCYDNALCESVFATLKRELLDRHRFRTSAEPSLAGFEIIEGWYNPHRLHFSIGYLSSFDYEAIHLAPPSPKSLPPTKIVQLQCGVL
jgi:putative transposase